MATRTPQCLAKLDRMNRTLRHQEADRVPISDFFWGAFLTRWREEFGLPADADIYSFYDLDWRVTRSNRDPHIRQFEVLNENEDEIVVRTGYDAVVRKKFSYPMPEFVSFDTDTIEKMLAFEFDDPWDPRRYFSAGDNQTAGIGDGFERDTPPWIDTVKSLYPDFPVYGSVYEGHEALWRIIGSHNVMLWIGLYPDDVGRFVERILEFDVECVKAQIKAAGGLLDGFVIWGDVAYKKGMLFSPAYWRKHFKPGVKAIVDVCHSHNLPVIYHGCGNALKIFDDLIECGIDAYNPLEAKAGLDVIDLRRRFGHRLAFCGNMDVIAWAAASQDELQSIVLRKLNAAKGGGFIFQSDHSVPNDVPPSSYDYVVRLVRERGVYPLALGPHDLPDIH